jgi:hypothetical protein
MAKNDYTSTFFDQQSSRVDKDRLSGVKNIIHQSIYEEKIANNGFYANIFIYLSIIAFSVMIIALKKKFLSIYTSAKENHSSFSMTDISLTHNLNKSIYSLFCISKEDRQQGELTITKCKVDPSCEKLNIDNVITTFDLKCENFITFRNIGILVRTIQFIFS